MILRDFECSECGLIFEQICGHEIEKWVCPKCRSLSRKIMTVGNMYTGNQEADWLKDVHEVVDKEGGPAHQEFLKNPTRANHKNWMKEAGVRFLETGEKPNRDVNMSKVKEEVIRKSIERSNQGAWR